MSSTENPLYALVFPSMMAPFVMLLVRGDEPHPRN
jgi:hypothetical protein